MEKAFKAKGMDGAKVVFENAVKKSQELGQVCSRPAKYTASNQEVIVGRVLVISDSLFACTRDVQLPHLV